MQCLDRLFPKFINTHLLVTAVSLTLISTSPSTLSAGGGDLPADAPISIKDPYIQVLHDLVYDQKPPAPVPDVDYGIDKKTGKFSHPKATPLVTDFPNFKGQLDYWDQKSYAKNVEVIGVYEDIASPFHSWQNIVDFGDKRYMYVYGSRNLRIFDITDARKRRISPV